MQTKQFLPLLCLLLLLSLPAVAQDDILIAAENDREAEIAADNRLEEILINRATRAVFDSDPSGIFMFIMAMEGGTLIPGFNEEFGITEEQKTHLREVIDSLEPENMDEFDAVIRGIRDKNRENINYEPNEEEEAVLASVFGYAMEAANISSTTAFTGEQMQKMDGMMLAITGGLESPFFNERMMDAIEMTDAQKEQFKMIDDATTQGREKLIAAVSTEIFKMADSGKPDIRGLLGTFSTFREYSRDLKQRRMAVLTPAQIAKVASLARLPRSLSLFNLLPQWGPGPDSWKPGDPLPPGAVPANRGPGNFPRGQ